MGAVRSMARLIAREKSLINSQATNEANEFPRNPKGKAEGQNRKHPVTAKQKKKGKKK